jgi:hypothetical protein
VRTRKKIDESLSLAFCCHNQLRLKYSVIIARHKERQELAVVKRAMCDEQIEFEKAGALKKTTVLRKRKKARHFSIEKPKCRTRWKIFSKKMMK